MLSTQDFLTLQMLSWHRRRNAGASLFIKQGCETVLDIFDMLRATALRTLNFGSSANARISIVKNCSHRSIPKSPARRLSNSTAYTFKSSFSSSCAKVRIKVKICAPRSSIVNIEVILAKTSHVIDLKFSSNIMFLIGGITSSTTFL